MPSPAAVTVAAAAPAGVSLPTFLIGILLLQAATLLLAYTAMKTELDQTWPLFGALAVAAIIVGSLVCLAQTELKRLIAYSSVGHMGFVLLGYVSARSRPSPNHQTEV